MEIRLGWQIRIVHVQVIYKHKKRPAIRVNPPQRVPVNSIGPAPAKHIAFQLVPIQQFLDLATVEALRKCVAQRLKIVFEMDEAASKTAPPGEKLCVRGKGCRPVTVLNQGLP